MPDTIDELRKEVQEARVNLIMVLDLIDMWYRNSGDSHTTRARLLDIRERVDAAYRRLLP